MSLVRKETGEVHLRLVLCILFRRELTALGYIDPCVSEDDPYDFADVLWHRPYDENSQSADTMMRDGRMRATILAQHPALGEIYADTLTPETFEALLAELISPFGEWIAFAQAHDPPPFYMSERDHLLKELYENTFHYLHHLRCHAGLISQDLRGGVLAVFHTSQPTIPLAKMVVGEVPSDKVADFWQLAEEEALRLLAHATEGHRLSSQSRDDGQRQYAGAVLTQGGYVVSFSGLSQIDDEALALLIVLDANLMDAEGTNALAVLARNTRYTEFAHALD
jgi:hypothetical protein